MNVIRTADAFNFMNKTENRVDFLLAKVRAHLRTVLPYCVLRGNMPHLSGARILTEELIDRKENAFYKLWSTVRILIIMQHM